MTEQIKHPEHYNGHPSGIECWDINGHLNANLAAAFKYVFRRDHKGTVEQNIEKAIEYLHKEKCEITTDIDSDLRSRFIVQENRSDQVTNSLREILKHESNFSIIRFYQTLACLVYSKGPRQKRMLVKDCAYALNGYLTDLDEAQMLDDEIMHMPV